MRIIRGYAHRNAWDGWVYDFATGFAGHLDCELVTDKRYREIKAFCIIELDNGKFWAIDPCDTVKASHCIARRYLVHEDCVGVLKSQYRPGFYRKREIHPWIYFPYAPKQYQDAANNIKSVSVSDRSSKLYWRGAARHGREKILPGLNPILYGGSRNRIPLAEYLKEMASCRVALSLRGVASINHREIEAFGIGVPVLMARPNNVMYNNLVPDYHYIEAEDLEPDAIISKFNEVVKQREHLEFIASNAQRWFNENVASPACYSLTTRIIGL